MAEPHHVSVLPIIVTICAAMVIAVPLMRFIGFSAVLGYLLGGFAIGPFVLGLVRHPEAVASLAEIGVVLLLFVIGLELRISKLVSMRADIFGAGSGQLLLTALAIGLAAFWLGVLLAGAVVLGLALALSATAVALQMLEERGHLQTNYGQRTFAVLLFQDMSIVPILALVPVLASAGAPAGGAIAYLLPVGKGVAALAAVLLVGRYLLNPVFRLLAATGGREVMTAAALLAALGAAETMELVGLSAALGAFLAGLLLAESDFKHQLEADIEPFRGLLLGLFFMSVGMSIDPQLVWSRLGLIVGLAVVLVAVKTAIAYVVLKATCPSGEDALRAASLLAPAGEFSFVIVPIAAAAALLPAGTTELITAVAALTMFIGPVVAKIVETVSDRRRRGAAAAAKDIPEDTFDGVSGSVLVIGFGRFAQIATQVLLAEGVQTTVIDNDVDLIAGASRFGFKVYYGDGRRLDVLRAAGAEQARIIAVCIDDKQTALDIVDLIQAEFPLARTFVRAHDRAHAIELMNRQVDYQIREMVESALIFGRSALEELGVERARAREIVNDVRKRDVARLTMQQAEGLMSGTDLILVKPMVRPEPLTLPRQTAKPLSRETRDVLAAEAGR